MQDIPYNEISDVLVFPQRLQCPRSVSTVIVPLYFIVRSPVYYSSSKEKGLVNIRFSCFRSVSSRFPSLIWIRSLMIIPWYVLNVCDIATYLINLVDKLNICPLVVLLFKSFFRTPNASDEE